MIGKVISALSVSARTQSTMSRASLHLPTLQRTLSTLPFTFATSATSTVVTPLLVAEPIATAMLIPNIATFDTIVMSQAALRVLEAVDSEIGRDTHAQISFESISSKSTRVLVILVQTISSTNNLMPNGVGMCFMTMVFVYERGYFHILEEILV